MDLDQSSLSEALATLGELLHARGHAYEIAVIGGGALLLCGLLERHSTRDLDIVARIDAREWLLAEPLPSPLAEAIRDVADALDLRVDWLNPGPTSMLQLGLPEGFADRCTVQQFSALRVRFASRIDQIAFKLFAAADHWPDRGKHLQDLRFLKPSAADLLDAARWCLTHDPSEGFREMQLAPVLATLGVERSDGE